MNDADMQTSINNSRTSDITMNDSKPNLHTYLMPVILPNLSINLLKMKRNLLYIRNQPVLRSKHFPPQL